MRMPLILPLLLSATVFYGQPIKVPHKIKFANIALHIREDARKEIQEKVDALTQNPYYFNKKAARAQSYFPIIEQIFEKENLPGDFKFLVLQESALIADAVSTSNAVGYWQFKDFTAEEMGLRVDKEIDERMNLVAATRGAARYLKQNNFYFNNWICALQAYQMGAGGARRALGDRYNGAKHMDITKKTYWYVKTFLAYKIAFEDAVKGKPEQTLSIYEARAKTSLQKVADELAIDLAELKRYNKWAKADIIPNDKQYAVLVPGNRPLSNRENVLNPDDAVAQTTLSIPVAPEKAYFQPKSVGIPVQGLKVNNLPVIAALQGEQLAAMANRAGIKLSAFLRYNDISTSHHVVPGALYFTVKKKSIAAVPFHKVTQRETPWALSQRYGIRLKNLRKYNDLPNDENLLSNGTILWLNDINPNRMGNTSNLDYVVELDRQQLFDWSGVNIGLSGS